MGNFKMKATIENFDVGEERDDQRPDFAETGLEGVTD